MIIAKTDRGMQVLKDRSVPLSPRQRAAFILIDGKKTLQQVLAATAAAGVTREDIEKLIELRLVYDVSPGETAAEYASVAKAQAEVTRHKQRTPQERFAEAYPIAAKLTGGLGLRGFRLNLAVEAAGNYDDLVALAPKIKDAVGAEKFKPLDDALNDR